MGLTANYLLMHTPCAVTDVRALTDFEDDLSWSTAYRDGWKIGLWDGDLLLKFRPDVLRAVATDTGAPAILGYLMDSDAAIVFATDGRSADWCALIGSQEVAAEYMSDTRMEAIVDAKTAAERFCGWAVAAGLVPSPPAIQALLEMDEADIFAEYDFFALLSALGVRTN